MRIVTGDFETYYDKEYSLSKLTTEEYIRDPRFEVIGISIKIDDGPAQWFTGTMEETRNWLEGIVDWSEVAFLAHNAMFDAAILNWHFDIRPKVIFDTLSMSRPLHGLQVGGSLKTLAKHYGIGEKGEEVVAALGLRRKDFTVLGMRAYGIYCCNDTDLCRKLFDIMAPAFNKAELKIIDNVIRMFTEPVFVLNQTKLENHLQEVRDRKAAMVKKVGLLALGMDEEGEAAYRLIAGDEEVDKAIKKVIGSGEKFANLLRDRGVEPPTKISATTKKPTYAFAKTDEAFTLLLDHPDEMVQALVEVRLGVKSTLEESRTLRFMDIAKRGPLPIPIKYAAAHTLRYGGMDKINMQNLPARGPNGGKLKSCIESPKDHVVIDCDSAQIEARCLAWLAEQNDLVEDFRLNRDIYSQMATDIYGRPINRKLKETDANGVEFFPMEKEGFVGKGTVLGCGYGMGPPRFVGHMKVAGVDLDLTMAQHIIRTYRGKFQNIVDLWAQAQRCLEAMIDKYAVPRFGNGLIQFHPEKGFLLPNGFWLNYHNLRREFDKESGKWEMFYDQRKGRGLLRTRIHGPKCIENLTQAVAGCVVRHQQVLITKKYPVRLPVHDANACIAHKDVADEARAYVEECMRTVPAWGVQNGIALPLNCESSVTTHYA